MVDAYASAPQYVDHLAPVWRALPWDNRGTFWCSTRDAETRARARGCEGVVYRWRRPRGENETPTLLASSVDLDRYTTGPGLPPVAFVEHGAGQTYSDVDSPGYAGGRGRDRVGLFLCPSERVADLNRERYPDATVVAVGPARLDPWIVALGCRGYDRLCPCQDGDACHYRGPDPMPLRTSRSTKTVALSFHWPCRLSREAGSAWPEYRPVLDALAGERHRWKILGHGHPRILERLRPYYAAAGIEVVDDFDAVLDRADVYVCDNSSTLYEFAATRRPVLCLTSKRWRRDVEHGLRFWDAVPGLEVESPGAVVAGVDLALADPAEAVVAREAAVRYAYGGLADGRAAERSAAAVVEWLGGPSLVGG